MCGRYHFSAGLLDGIRGLTEQEDWKLELRVLDRDIHLGDTAPTVMAAGDQDGSLRTYRQKWGYLGPGGEGLVSNAKSKSVFGKRMFRDSTSQCRTAVLASWSCEQNKNREKFAFTKEGNRILFLAGLYSRYEDGDHFVILITQANTSMAPVHSHMPLVLERGQVREWILDNKKTKELLGQKPSRLVRGCEYEQQILF